MVYSESKEMVQVVFVSSPLKFVCQLQDEWNQVRMMNQEFMRICEHPRNRDKRLQRLDHGV